MSLIWREPSDRLVHAKAEDKRRGRTEHEGFREQLAGPINLHPFEGARVKTTKAYIVRLQLDVAIRKSLIFLIKWTIKIIFLV